MTASGRTPTAVLRLQGAWDLDALDDLQAAVDQALGRDEAVSMHLTIDLREVGFIDSATILKLIHTRQRLVGRDRTLLTRCVAGPVARVLQQLDVAHSSACRSTAP